MRYCPLGTGLCTVVALRRCPMCGNVNTLSDLSKQLRLPAEALTGMLRR